MEYQHEQHSVHLVVYHFVWCPKRRRKVLDGEEAQQLDTSSLPATMNAALLYGLRSIGIERIPVPTPRKDEVLVAVEAAGICGSDLHFYLGERALQGAMVLGHEVTSRVVAVGAGVPAERLGERVAIEPSIPCGACGLCQRGLGRLCTAKQIVGQTRQGGLAEYVAVEHRFAWPVPEAGMSHLIIAVDPRTPQGRQKFQKSPPDARQRASLSTGSDACQGRR